MADAEEPWGCVPLVDKSNCTPEMQLRLIYFHWINIALTIPLPILVGVVCIRRARTFHERVNPFLVSTMITMFSFICASHHPKINLFPTRNTDHA